MARLTITRETLNALFARSGNRCAFPGCTHELVTERNLFVGQVCHIEAASPGGPRFNHSSSDEERRSARNLLLLCYRHHKETDDVERFSVSLLLKIKSDHEAKFSENPFKVNEAFLYRLQAEMEAYWASLESRNRDNHVVPNLSVRIPIASTTDGVFAQVRRSFERVDEILEYLARTDEALNSEIREHLLRIGYEVTAYDTTPYYENPFYHRNWEMHALAARNVLTDLSVALQELEVRFYEEYIKTHPGDIDAKATFDRAKSLLQDMATSAGYAD